ncbi:MAG TPA: deoxyribonuclease [Woeseiaceae bacterium]
MAREMNTINDIPRQGGQFDPRLVIGIVVAAIIVVAIIYLFMRAPDPEPIPEPLPESTRPLETVTPAETAAQRGDSAREIIEELRSSTDDIDYPVAYERAQQFHADGRFADAQLLLFFAARGGHAPAAFDLATLHDPNHHDGQSSLAEEPDAFQAYRWYVTARDAGHEDADERLAELRAWAENTAASGDADAERLLLQWE